MKENIEDIIFYVFGKPLALAVGVMTVSAMGLLFFFDPDWRREWD